MKEPRKIILILGNGFDLDRGLKTSYKDFWESHYCPIEYPAPLIKHLNKRWGKNLEKVRWYDLEQELMEYYKSIRYSLNYDIINNSERSAIRNVDLSKLRSGFPANHYTALCSLQEKGLLIETTYGYSIPQKEELLLSPIDRDRNAFLLIKEGLREYIKKINYSSISKPDSTANRVLHASLAASNNNNFVSIYSFNYTTFNSKNSHFEHLFHYVHGNCHSGDIIIGTMDSSDYNENYDYLQKAFSPIFNPHALVPELLDADDVIFFGHSIGENDRQYFKAFFKQQTDYTQPKRKTITFFTRDDEAVLNIKRSLQRMTDSNLSALCSLNDVSFYKTKSIEESPNVLDKFLAKY